MRLERSTWIVLAAAVVVVGSLGSGGLVVWRTIQGWSADQPMPGVWGWLLLSIVIILTLGVSVYVARLVLVQSLSNFSDAGVGQPSLFSSVFIRWADVTRVRVSEVTIEMWSPRDSIRLNLYTFRRPEEVIELVKLRVPPSARLE